ncbi:malate synthase A [Candidatus Viridilinea mediisalina]|uniref:Malate synthase n=1 Tax=Candidatus Viridilinea mediisalina TaxID=2024553 RepID=A0A2A6RLN3_9CHLR|nr:malate synthase A [Candidatus Viridilinea mediisalina]PDW04014.1 malate synthase A [Candidatus Viridilinea mediisalina]
MSDLKVPAGMAITGRVTPEYAEVLTPEALELVAKLHRAFNPRRQELLALRQQRQAALDAGKLPDFLPETAEVRAGDWKIAPFPAQINDRRVEITGPVDRKMIINALNSGAKVFMADFEDANTPNWDNQVGGQINLRDALRRTIDFTSPEGKQYALNAETALLFVRPRGWHLDEKHVTVDGEVVSGGIFDFALYLYHNGKQAIEVQGGPYFYLPKLESHLEARLWNEIFVMAQEYVGLPQGTIKATVLIETILAAFEMDEILYELRDHSAGLNCGRWDYIFSCIKKFRTNPDFCLADRALVTMTTHFMRSYSLLCIKTCHRRGAHAMGGMAAQIPIKNDAEANAAALARVRADKEREANDGHDGTWVAHPGLVPIAMDAFNAVMQTPNQIERQRDDVAITAADILKFGPEAPITEQGLRMNINVGIQYLGSWLAGNGCVPVFNLMEDAATAEISRAQIWQWIRSPKGVLDDGRKVTVEMFNQMLPEELEKVRTHLGSAFNDGRYEEAAELFAGITTSDDFVEFLTLPAYAKID